MKEGLQEPRRSCLVYLNRQTRIAGERSLLKRTSKVKLPVFHIKRYSKSSIIKKVQKWYIKRQTDGMEQNVQIHTKYTWEFRTVFHKV